MWKAQIAANFSGFNLPDASSDFKFGADNKTHEFYEINPFGQVPTLQTGAAQGVFESNAIARYVVRAGKDQALLGTSPLDSTRIDAYLDRLVNVETQGSRWIYKAQGAPWSTSYTQDYVTEGIRALENELAGFERALKGREFLVGDTVTLADIVFYAFFIRVFETCLGADDRQKYALVFAQIKKLAALPQFSKVKPLPSPLPAIRPSLSYPSVDVTATTLQAFENRALVAEEALNRLENRVAHMESGFAFKKAGPVPGVKVALLIVDVQYDFCPPNGSLAVTEGDQIIPVINDMRRNLHFDKVVLTQDWHPVGHCSFCSTWAKEGAKLFTIHKMPNGVDQMMWPDHCIQGSKGAEFHGSLVQLPTDTIVQKGTCMTRDSYSGFLDNDRKTKTELEQLLKADGITHTVVVGLAFDYCVGFTALDSQEAGFKTCVVRDASRGVAPATSAEMEGRMNKAGVVIVDSSKVLDFLKN